QGATQHVKEIEENSTPSKSKGDPAKSPTYESIENTNCPSSEFGIKVDEIAPSTQMSDMARPVHSREEINAFSSTDVFLSGHIPECLKNVDFDVTRKETSSLHHRGEKEEDATSFKDPVYVDTSILSS
ncbi:MAG: hypothetical protein ACK56I_01465, partial [bacterium]